MSGQTAVRDINEFDAAMQRTLEAGMPSIKVEYRLFALTRLGERPVEAERFAAFLERPEDEAIALAVEHAQGRSEGRLVHIDLSVPDRLARRWLVVGDRRIGMSGCAPDLFGITAVLDVPFRGQCTLRGHRGADSGRLCARRRRSRRLPWR